MAPRKTRAAAKAQTETTPVDTPIDQEDQTPEPEHDLDPEEVDEEEEEEPIEEDMSKAKGKKSKKGGKKKAGMKPTKTDSPEVAPTEIISEDVAAPAAMEDGEFNAAAMPVLRSPKKDAVPIGEPIQIAS
jgi:hypothetical protein